MSKYRQILKHEATHFVLIFLTIFSVDILINLFTTPNIRKELFLLGYLLYTALIFPFAAILYYLIRTVRQFGPSDNSPFFSFWSLLLPLAQFYPLYKLHLPDRFKSMALILTLISAIIFTFLWSWYSRKIGEMGRKFLFLWTQVILAFAILIGIHLNTTYVRKLFSLKSLIINLILVISIFVLLVAGKKIRLFLKKRRKKITKEKSVFFPSLMLGFDLLVLIALLIWPVEPTILKAANNTPSNIGADHQTRPNIVLINLSSVRTRNMEIYGYEQETMPHLTKWAKNVTHYKSAYSNSSRTLSSLASIFTGKYPSLHKAQIKPPALFKDTDIPITEEMLITPLQTGFPTIAQILKAYGYTTSAISANHLELNPVNGLAYGFDYIDFSYDDVPSLLPYRLLRPASKFASPLVKLYRPYKMAEVISGKAVTWLKNNEGNPFFLYLHYMDAQMPHTPLLEYKKLYYDEEKVDKARYPKLALKTMQYNAKLRYLDDQIEHLLKTIERFDWYNDSLIIITADHGESLGEWGKYGNGITLKNQEISIPLFVKYPQQKEAEEISYPVQGLDIFSTALETAGIQIDEHTESVNLIIQDGRFILSELEPSLLVIEEYGKPFAKPIKSVVIGTNIIYLRNRSAFQVFDMANDPEETRSILKQSHNIAREAEMKLRAILSN